MSLDAETVTILTGGLATLAIFSFLIRENPFYRLFEHLFIGIAAGIGALFAIKNFLWPKVLMPLFGLNLLVFPDGTRSADYNPALLIYLLPIAFGLLYYTAYSARFAWMSKLVIGFTLGIGAGAAFQGVFNEMLPQITGSFKPLVVISEGSLNVGESLSNIAFVFTLLAVMYYFFFSLKEQDSPLRPLSKAGRWLMMVCFGAFFGSTVMARMALLVERLQFLQDDWFPALARLVGL